MKKSSSSDVKLFAALSYLWILFLIPILLKRDSKFALYHAKQGLVFFIFSTLVGFIAWVPLIGWALAIFVFVLFLIGLINSLSGRMEPLPLIGKYAKKINI